MKIESTNYGGGENHCRCQAIIPKNCHECKECAIDSDNQEDIKYYVEEKTMAWTYMANNSGRRRRFSLSYRN